MHLVIINSYFVGILRNMLFATLILLAVNMKDGKHLNYNIPILSSFWTRNPFIFDI